MNKLQLLSSGIFMATLVWAYTVHAETIYQCEQPDGTIEFSNRGCSKFSTLERKKTYRHKKFYKVKKHPAYHRLNISHLQSRIIQSTSADEMEKHARAITDTVMSTAQQGQLRIACNAIASTYAKLARQFEQQKRQGVPVSSPSVKMQMLFEDIMLAEATISTANELDREITLAWKKYRSGSI